MKHINTVLSILLALSSLSCFGQSVQKNLTKAEFDSVKYFCPDFEAGIVVFNDGAKENGAVNIDAMDQKVMFVSDDGQKKVLTNNNSVDRVIIGRRVFYFRGGKFIELVDFNGEAGLGKSLTVTLIESQTKGAYGYVSQTTSIKQVSSIYDGSGQYYDTNERDMINVIIKNVPYIFRDGKFTRASKKLMLKSFPDKKQAIGEYLEASSVDFENYEQVEKLYNTAIK
ncbi:MAG: hypothetical protein KBT00_02245 [Bacteroidales bacterium]|nr:hypothetical protein [Candidatus Cacconaster merdequi]